MCPESGRSDGPGRQRAIYGQDVPDTAGIAFNPQEAADADSILNPNASRGEAKDQIAHAMGKHLAKQGEALDALAYDSEFGGFQKRYGDTAELHPNPQSSDIQAAYEKAKKLPDPSSEAVKALYQQYADDTSEHVNAEGTPDPKSGEAKEAYEDYKREKMEELEEDQREEAEQSYWNQGHDEYARQADKIAEKASDTYDEVKVAIAEKQAAFEPSEYGDVSEHPTLPGLDVERTGTSAAADRYSQSELIAQWEADGEDAEFLQDEEFLRAVGDKLPPLDRDEALAGTEFENDADKRTEWLDEYVQSEMQDHEFDFSAVPDFAEWYEGEYGLSPEDYTTGPESFDDWYRLKYGAYADKWKPTDNFDQWYYQTYGVKPKDWAGEGGEGAAAKTREVLARNIADSLIEAWANTSSDSNMKSMMMQIAAADTFNLGATYSKSLLAGGIYDRAAALYEKHKPVVQSFLRGMQADTQAWLERNGLAKDGYVTLYRGFGARSEQEPGLASVDLQKGAVVDVLLQPMSSYSSSYGTAYDFGSGEVPLMTAIRVPVSKILSSARTGYGCLNESEFVILGGRYPSFIMRRGAVQREEFMRILRSFKPGRQAVKLIPGERL